jgi:hypothetical protein
MEYLIIILKTMNKAISGEFKMSCRLKSQVESTVFLYIVPLPVVQPTADERLWKWKKAQI